MMAVSIAVTISAPIVLASVTHYRFDAIHCKRLTHKWNNKEDDYDAHFCTQSTMKNVRSNSILIERWSTKHDQRMSIKGRVVKLNSFALQSVTRQELQNVIKERLLQDRNVQCMRQSCSRQLFKAPLNCKACKNRKLCKVWWSSRF